MGVAIVEKVQYGLPIGKIAVSDAVQAKVRAVAKDFWISQEADGFMEGVDTWKPGNEFSLDWLPLEKLATLGYRPNPKTGHWVMTTGVDTHVDGIWGRTLVWVLFNDAMYFKQGRKKVVHKPGEWYIFNDALDHEVDVTKSSPDQAVYLGWAVQLEALS